MITPTSQPVSLPAPEWAARMPVETESGKTSLGPGMIVTAEIHTGRRRISRPELRAIEGGLIASMLDRRPAA